MGPDADRPRGSKRATHARLRAGSGPGKVTGSWGRDADSDSPAAGPGTARRGLLAAALAPSWQ